MCSCWRTSATNTHVPRLQMLQRSSCPCLAPSDRPDSRAVNNRSPRLVPPNDLLCRTRSEVTSFMTRSLQCVHPRHGSSDYVGFPVIQWAYDLVKTRPADMKPSRSWGGRWGIIEYMGTQGKPNMENKVIWVDASSHFRRIMHSCGFIPMWAWSLPVHRSAHHCERCLNHVDAYYNKYRRNVCKHCVTVINFKCQTFSLINFQNASKLEKSADDRSSPWLLTK